MSRIRAASPLLFAFLIPVAALPAYGRQEVTFTTTADFQNGNQEGLVSISGNQITRTALNAGPLGAFSQGTALSTPQIYHSSVYHNGYVYTFGGGISTGPFLADVYYAPVTNGTVGSWNPTQSLPVANRWHASVAYNGYVYVLGGVDVGPTTSATVRMAVLNADGTVGAWSTTTALPSPRNGHSAVVHNGFIYVIGGLDASSSYLADAIVARVNADGTLGSWTSTTPIPSGRHSHGAAAFNDFMYVAGGSASFAAGVPQLTEVYVAPIGTNGTLGQWTTTTPLPSGRAKIGVVALAGHLYSFGGFDGSPYALPNSVVAPIAANGTIGAWTDTVALPISPGMYAMGIVVAEGAVITTGGYAYSTGSPLWRSEVLINTPQPDTANAAQVLPLLKGEYSHLVDFGADRPVQGIRIHGTAPSGGKVRLQYRLATAANPVFGAEQVVDPFPLGTGIAVAGTARWVWVRLTLDDRGRTDSLTLVTANPTFVTDYTIGDVPSPDKPRGISPSSEVSFGDPGGGPVRFEWSTLTRDGQAIAGAKYDLDVSLDPTFQTTLHSLVDLTGTSTSIELPLSDPKQPYSWRLRGRDPAHLNSISEWSDPLSFKVVMDDLVDHGAGDCTIAAPATRGPLALAILGLLALLGASRIRRARTAA
ncbi:MAG TPA: hypothetical protein VK661_02770 [Planctomycetota bacterium]|nr:hypothetical protein [Planctomycetota bacterium]